MQNGGQGTPLPQETTPTLPPQPPLGGPARSQGAGVSGLPVTAAAETDGPLESRGPGHSGMGLPPGREGRGGTAGQSGGHSRPREVG